VTGSILLAGDLGLRLVDRDTVPPRLNSAPVRVQPSHGPLGTSLGTFVRFVDEWRCAGENEDTLALPGIDIGNVSAGRVCMPHLVLTVLFHCYTFVHPW
jgi:hypothetical protein